MSRDEDHAAAVVFGPEEALRLGITLHEKGCLTEAEAVYRRVLAAADDAVDALHFLAVLCHQTDRNAEALALVDRILALRPDLPDAHSNRGNALEALGRPQEAEACYRRAIALRPDHAAAHNNLGVVLMGAGRLGEAVQTCRQAAALAPEAADFHYNLGNALHRLGRFEEAAAAYRDTVGLLPRHAQARQGLARTLLRLGRAREAAEVFEEWLRADPGDPVARHLCAAYRGDDVPDRASDAYVQRLFDDLAESFDSHLTSLGYRAPDVVADALAATLPEPPGDRVVLDAGCGTGLCGPLLRPHARRLVGVDLSARMLAKAALREVYDDLCEEELTAFLDRHPGSFDAIACADTLCYFGALEPVFQAAAAALRPGGVFAFTLEEAGDDLAEPGFRLNPHGRYSHTRACLERALAGSGLAGATVSRTVLRSEAGSPVTGLLAVTRRGP